MTKVTVPSSPGELEEFLATEGNRAELLNDSEKFGEFIANYAKTVAVKDPDLLAQINEQTQAAMRQFLIDNGYDKGTPVDLAARVAADRKAAAAVATGKGAAYNKAAPGAKLDDDVDFGSAGEYLQAIWHRAGSLANRSDLAAKRAQIEQIQAAYSSTVPADGGFLIPETLRSQLLSVALEMAVVRPRAQVLPMSTLRLPIPTIDSTSNEDSVFGGVVGYWTEEGAELVESNVEFGRVVLEARKLTGYTEMPNELIADAIAGSAFFSQTFPKAIAFFEDRAFLTGDGVGKPLGVIGNPATVTVTRTDSTNHVITFADAAKMYSRMLPSSLGSAVWLCAPDALPDVLQMELSDGSPAVLLTSGLGATPTLNLMGRPIIVSEKIPKQSAAGALAFIDFGYYLIGDRQAMQAEASAHYKFGNDKTAFRVIERVDGRPWLTSDITPANGSSNTLSAYVEVSA